MDKDLVKYMLPPQPNSARQPQASGKQRKKNISKYGRADAKDEPCNVVGKALDMGYNPRVSQEAAAVERRLKTLHGFDFAAKLGRKKKNPEPSAAWAQVASVPYYGVPTPRKRD